MEGKKKTSLNKRALNTIVMLFSLVLLPPSGIILHFTYDLARNNLLRHLVMSIHNFAAIIFLVSGVLHIIANWKALKRYMISKVSEYISVKFEMVIAFIVVIGIITLFSSHVFHLN